MAFIPNPECKLTVNHINGVKTNNYISNLEWATHSENCLHSFRELGRVNTLHRKGKFGRDHNSSKAVIRCSLDGVELQEYGSMMEAERDGFSNSHISKCCSGKLKEHKGFKWRIKV
jgi:hypothetical protein